MISKNPLSISRRGSKSKDIKDTASNSKRNDRILDDFSSSEENNCQLFIEGATDSDIFVTQGKIRFFSP